MQPFRPDLNLSRTNGDLAWDGCSLRRLAQAYDTPLYVINSRVLEDAYDQFSAAFLNAGVDARVFFSLKTNPVPEVIRVLGAAGCGAEVISEDELRLVRKLDIDGSRIIVNGAVKTDGLLEASVEAGVALVNMETLDELQRLQQAARRAGKKVKVALRVLPRLRSSRFDMTLSTSRAGSPTGFIAGSKTWLEALDFLETASCLQLRGLHFHLGSGIQAARPYQQTLKQLLPLWKSLCERGFYLDRLDIGGGFNVPSLKSYSIWEAARLMMRGSSAKRKTPADKGFLLAEVARACRTFIDALPAHNRPAIFVEPGRALSASSQVLLLAVQAIKENEKGEHFALCSGGAMSLSPMLWSEYHEILPVNGMNQQPEKVYTLLGNMPAPLDIVAHRKKLPELHRGDVLAMLDVGAYFTSLGNTFAGALPAMVLIDAGTPRLIRPRLSGEALFQCVKQAPIL